MYMYIGGILIGVSHDTELCNYVRWAKKAYKFVMTNQHPYDESRKINTLWRGMYLYITIIHIHADYRYQVMIICVFDFIPHKRMHFGAGMQIFS